MHKIYNWEEFNESVINRKIGKAKKYLNLGSRYIDNYSVLNSDKIDYLIKELEISNPKDINKFLPEIKMFIKNLEKLSEDFKTSDKGTEYSTIMTIVTILTDIKHDIEKINIPMEDSKKRLIIILNQLKKYVYNKGN